MSPNHDDQQCLQGGGGVHVPLSATVYTLQNNCYLFTTEGGFDYMVFVGLVILVMSRRPCCGK